MHSCSTPSGVVPHSSASQREAPAESNAFVTHLITSSTAIDCDRQESGSILAGFLRLHYGLAVPRHRSESIGPLSGISTHRADDPLQLMMRHRLNISSRVRRIKRP